MSEPSTTARPDAARPRHRWARPATVILELFWLLGALTGVLGLIPAQETATDLPPLTPSIGEIVLSLLGPLLLVALLGWFLVLAPGWSRRQKGALTATPVAAVVVVLVLAQIGPGWVTAAVGLAVIALLASVPMRLASVSA